MKNLKKLKDTVENAERELEHAKLEFLEEFCQTERSAAEIESASGSVIGRHSVRHYVGSLPGRLRTRPGRRIITAAILDPITGEVTSKRITREQSVLLYRWRD